MKTMPPTAQEQPSQPDEPAQRANRFGPLLRYDLPASLVVFLVALPLSLGIAVASNAPVLAGVIAAIVGGIVAGTLGGSPLQVSGPAAGLTVVVAGLVDQFGWAVTCAITVLAGVLQILFGMSRLARAALAISPVVVYAMLAGIGITIALQQLHVLLGGESASSSWENLAGLPEQLTSIQFAGLVFGVLVIAIMVGWKWVPGPIGKVPGPLVAVVGVTALSVVIGFDGDRIKIDGSLIDAIALPSLPDGNWGAFTAGVLTIAMIASVESLLCAVAVDRIQNGPRTNFNREMIGQGAANMSSGMLGGLPVTGVIVRSSTNVAAGAKTRASGIMHGVWVLLFALPFAWLIQLIPSAALAGLLIVIGARLINRTHIQNAARTGDIAVYAVTVFCVVFVNLLGGVMIGLALAVVLTVWRVVRTSIHAEPVHNGNWRVIIEGSCTFLSLPRLTRELQSVPSGTDVTVEMSVDYLDHPAYEAINDWQRQHCAAGGTVEIHDLGTIDMDSADKGPPTRGLNPFDKRSGVVPWNSWQPRQSPSVLHGLAAYHRRTAEVLRPHMKELEHAQRPETLFLTCVDSRIVPNVITSSGPGDLFTIRNVGNMVPAGQQDTSVEAAIAFAVDKLQVTSVVVCGHSSCGAMNALLSDSRAPQGQGENSLDVWLDYGNVALDAFADGDHPVAQSAATAGYGRVDQLSMVNVAVQVETLSAHPLVASARQRGQLSVIGLFYDIPKAAALHVTPASVDQLADELVDELVNQLVHEPAKAST